MKRNQKIALILLALVSIYATFISVYTEYQRLMEEEESVQSQILQPDDEILENLIIAPSVETEDIVEWNFVDDIADENGEILISVSCSTPYSDGTEEFSINLNSYYEKVRSTVVDYLNYEGYDIAEAEKAVFKEQFVPLRYNEKFQVTYRDENLVSIMRTLTIVTNENEFTRVECEILDGNNGTLVLSTDICANFYEMMSLNDELDNAIDYFDYYLTDEGIYVIQAGKNVLFEYENLQLEEKFAYLGEENANN